MISAFGVDHGGLSKNVVGGLVHGFASGQSSRALKTLTSVTHSGLYSPADVKAFNAERVAARAKVRAVGSGSERVGEHVGYHSTKYAAGAGAGAGVAAGAGLRHRKDPK